MTVPENYLTEFFSRTLLFTRSTFTPEFEMADEKYLRQLSTSEIAISGTREHFESASGQYMALMLINLLSRFCLKIEIVLIGDVHTVISHPFVTGNSFIENVLDLAKKINPSIDVRVSDGRQKRYDYVIVIGDQNREIGKSIYINADGWIAYANTESNGTSWISKNINPIGAYVAACVGAAELFKSIFARFKHRQRIGSLIFSAFDYGFKNIPAYNPPIPTLLNINNANFISMGAINSAVLFTLCSFPNSHIEASIIEPENLDVSNLNRYAFSLADDAINRIAKIDSALKFAKSHLTPKRLLRLPFEKIADQLNANELAVIGVDNVEGRWALQKSNPDEIICGGTTGMGDIQISTYSRRDNGACMGCFYPEPLPAGTMPTVSFVSIMSGVLMAGEIIKGHVADYNLFRLKNNLNLSLLSGQFYQYKHITKSDCCAIHCAK